MVCKQKIWNKERNTQTKQVESRFFIANELWGGPRVARPHMMLQNDAFRVILGIHLSHLRSRVKQF